ncbi:MAG TPA: HAD hydrolase family protein [Verrucomicrobiae bacterium]|jgi:3-deoxy-D-manno-octulosonate 8-phosphate phosphatase (KDO 8-P phosphatase)|nr:HAD hydrolase family protein [Verrucomicrobiae bacterium]
MKRLSPKLLSQLAKIKLFVCDVDGVLTDGAIYIGGTREIKRFSIHDGLGLVLLRRAGIKTAWVSSRPSLATTMRARELKITFLVQQRDQLSKAAAIEAILARETLKWENVCFVGDDIVDLGPLEKAGVGAAVADAVDEAKGAAQLVTRAAGGHGAIREMTELILKAQGKWDSIIAGYRE